MTWCGERRIATGSKVLIGGTSAGRARDASGAAACNRAVTVTLCAAGQFSSGANGRLVTCVTHSLVIAVIRPITWIGKFGANQDASLTRLFIGSLQLSAVCWLAYWSTFYSPLIGSGLGADVCGEGGGEDARFLRDSSPLKLSQRCGHGRRPLNESIGASSIAADATGLLIHLYWIALDCIDLHCVGLRQVSCSLPVHQQLVQVH